MKRKKKERPAPRRARALVRGKKRSRKKFEISHLMRGEDREKKKEKKGQIGKTGEFSSSAFTTCSLKGERKRKNISYITMGIHRVERKREKCMRRSFLISL